MRYLYIKGIEAQNFQQLYERLRLFSSTLYPFLKEDGVIRLLKEQDSRDVFFNKLYNNAHAKQEIFYAQALFCNPDEYHALLMAERNHNEVIMPFVRTKAALLVMNGSRLYNINNRNFEMDIFNGIDESLLVKSKSGLSFPYTDWMSNFADSVLEFYISNNWFQGIDFDFETFYKRYYTDKRFAASLPVQIAIWKLLIVKLYSERYSLSL